MSNVATYDPQIIQVTLSPEEHERLVRLEADIDMGITEMISGEKLREVGYKRIVKAAREINESNLLRDQGSLTFDEYLREKFLRYDTGSGNYYRLIRGAIATAQIAQLTRNKYDFTPDVVLPSNERQVRPIVDANLAPIAQAQVWRAAVELRSEEEKQKDKPPTSATVALAVEAMVKNRNKPSVVESPDILAQKAMQIKMDRILDQVRGLDIDWQIKFLRKLGDELGATVTL